MSWEVPWGKSEEELAYNLDSLCKNVIYEGSQHTKDTLDVKQMEKLKSREVK